MDSRKQFEEWVRARAERAPSGFYPQLLHRCTLDDTRYVISWVDSAFEGWQAARAESEEMKDSRRDIDKAIYALTDSLDYEWTGDFRPEIETLNGAHMRYKIKCKRART